MQVKYDPEVDGVFFIFSNKPVVETEELQPGVFVDRDAEDQVVSVEILNFSTREKGIELPMVLDWMGNEGSDTERTAGPA